MPVSGYSSRSSCAAGGCPRSVKRRRHADIEDDGPSGGVAGLALMAASSSAPEATLGVTSAPSERKSRVRAAAEQPGVFRDRYGRKGPSPPHAPSPWPGGPVDDDLPVDRVDAGRPCWPARGLACPAAGVRRDAPPLPSSFDHHLQQGLPGPAP